MGCGGGDGPADPPDPPEVVDFPDLLSELDMSSSVLFAPAYELWTNGAEKARFIDLLDGGAIDNTDRRAWSFPEGTRLVKTFSFRTEASPTVARPVETRILLRRGGRWRTGIYLWRSDGSDAERFDGGVPVGVPIVDPAGRSFTHQVPSTTQCLACHDQNTQFPIGFSELQLNSRLPGQGVTQLERFEQLGFFADPIPEDPARVEGDDALTREALGYVKANCVHCHNERSTFGDYTPGSFLETTVGKTGFTGALLVDPGHPFDSFVFQRLSQGEMPPLGVQLLDAEGIDLIRRWILSLTP